MPRKARDERLDNRTARLRLKPRREPYWRTIQQGRAIGYRRLTGGKAGTWIAQFYDRGAERPRQYKALGTADDMLDHDGADTLTFAQAQDRAREWFALLVKTGGKATAPLTVKQAMDEYLADYSARGGKARRDLETTIKAHILPKLGDRLVADLTYAAIRAWHRALATAPARLRTAPGAAKQRTRALTGEDAHRARRSTANNILTVVKAALNFAYNEGKVAGDDAWRRVKPFRNVQAARVRYLTDDEAARLVNACQPDLRALVVAALLTGCRYQELATLRPADVDVAAGVLTIRTSKSGIPRTVVLTAEAGGFFRQAMAGKAATDRLLPRADGSAWVKSVQFRPLRAACKAARIAPAVSFHILRHTHASRLAMRGVPLQVIAAQLGHSDTKITMRHYAHLSPGYVADTIRQAFGSLNLVPAANVTTLRPA